MAPPEAPTEPGDDAAREARLVDIAKLGGDAALEGFLKRFADHLRLLLNEEPAGGWSAADAHRAVGLAGILGFVAVERTWRELEDAPRPAPEIVRIHARETAREALAYIVGRQTV